MNISNGVVRRRIEINIPGSKSKDFSIFQLAFSPDGATLAVLSSEIPVSTSSRGIVSPDIINGKVSLWNVATGHLIRVFANNAQPLVGMTISPDGTLLAAGGIKNALVWNIATGVIVRTWKMPTTLDWAACFSPDSRTLATGDASGTVQLWRIR